MTMLRCLSASAAGLVALGGLSVAAVAEPSGAVIAVIQQSQADGEGGKRVLQVEGPVFSGDQIITGARGEAQIKFLDDTKLVVGPNSQMTIDAFVFTGKGTAAEVLAERRPRRLPLHHRQEPEGGLLDQHTVSHDRRARHRVRLHYRADPRRNRGRDLRRHDDHLPEGDRSRQPARSPRASSRATHAVSASSPPTTCAT